MRAQNHNTKAEPGFVKRRNRISGQFSPRQTEMLESPAYRALSLSAHRVISRIEIELGSHGGNDNGRLPVTKLDFVEYGISARLVAAAIREAEALGFIRVTEHGRGGNAEHRHPNKFFLTFAHGRDSRANPPTHDWRKIKNLEEAMEIARAARSNKNPRAVQFAQRAQKTENRTHSVAPAPDPLSEPENQKSPDPLSVPTGSGHLVIPLSISRVGSRPLLSPMCWATPRLLEVIDPAERTAIQGLWSPKIPLADSEALSPTALVLELVGKLPTELRMMALGLQP
jgi:hypothetical protein